MLRRTFFGAGGAAVLAPLLPKSEAKADVVVPTPVVIVNGRRVPFYRYDGSFLDWKRVALWKTGIFLDGDIYICMSFAAPLFLKAMIREIEAHPARHYVIFVDRDGLCASWYNFGTDGMSVPNKITPQTYPQEPRFTPKVR